MGSDLFFENKKYISAKDAAALTSYSKDYVGQLCRAGKVEAKRIGHTWYVSEDSILAYKSTPTTFDFSQNLKAKVPVVSTPTQEQVVEKIPEEVISSPVVVANTESEIISPLPSPFISVANENKIEDKFETKKSEFENIVPLKKVYSAPEKIPEARIISERIVSTPKGKILSPYDSVFKKVVPTVFAIVLAIGLIGYFSAEDSSLNKYTKAGLRGLNAAVVEATEGLNVLDHAGVVVYNEINSWFGGNIYSKVAGLFGGKTSTTPTDVNVTKTETPKTPPSKTPTTNVITKATTTTPTKPTNTPTNTQVAISPTSNPTKVINTTNVVERIIERIAPSDITSAYLDSRLQELSNEMMSKFYGLSTGSGGSVTNIYQQIAHSQRIDNLSGTTITSPIISGGSISNTNISGGTISGATISGVSITGDLTLGTTTVTNLIVSNTSTSTYAGGIAVSGGCVSVNGTCIGAGGAGNPGGGNTQIQFNDGGVFNGTDGFVWDKTNERLGIGTTSPFQKLSVAGNVIANTFIATSTATSTFTGGISTNLLSVTSALSSSTFANGINLTSGCFSINGSCITGNGGAGSGITSLGSGYSSTTGSAITFGTSTLSFNGLTLGQTIVSAANSLT
ncbi:MAG TPA: helix-turn-helix domain-containing protein, partial [Candidatus Paceibacterota bacterium]